jgi:hypothetical protein
MAESYAKHLDRLEHSRHAKRERRQAPIKRTCRRHHFGESTATPMSIMPGRIGHLLQQGGATGKQASRSC